MRPSVPGIHHVTAIAGKAQRNVDFYAGVLGLRLVKKTVNFDDNFTYHLYFGDAVGSAGTAMTFFPWEHAQRGRPGRGLTRATAFRAPEGSLGFWTERLTNAGVPVTPYERFGIAGIRFDDPDGLALEIETGPIGATRAWETGGITEATALRGFAGVTLNSVSPARTADFLERALGFTRIGAEGQTVRFAPSGRADDSWVDVIETRDEAGRFGAGIVHHVAFRTLSDADQQAWIEHLYNLGFHPTGVKDRQYFRSIYFHEPGGVLFEIATDGPGFLVDESEAELGRGLKLPPWIERRRAEIEPALVPLNY